MRLAALTLAAVASAAFSFQALAGDCSLARAALEEAKRIDPSKQTKAEKLIAWINERASTSPH